MIRRALCCIAAVVLLPALPASAAPKDARVRTIARLDFPTQIAMKGSTMFVTQKAGRVRIIRDGKLLATPFVTVQTDDSGEGGLLGIALHPSFDEGQPWVYLFRSSADGSKDLVERYRANGSRAGKREVILDNIPAARIHHGGVMTFGPDGKLYIANGEHGDPSAAQDPARLGGKVYRLNDDGSIPRDNPFPGEPTYTYGHRNMFGIAVAPDGALWVSENGDNDHDEVNRLIPGRNYGWPKAEGKTGRFTNPVVDYPRIIVPTGIDFARAPFPASMRGDLFLGTYSQGTIRRLHLSGNRVTADTVFHRGEQIVALHFGPQGLYYATPSAVKLISYPVKASPPPTTSASAQPSPTVIPDEISDDFFSQRITGSLFLAFFGLAGYALARTLRNAQKRRNPPR